MSATRDVRLEPPGPTGTPLLGSLLPFKRDLLPFLMRTSRQYGDVCRFKLGPKSIYFVNHPDHIRHILLDNYRGYRKSEGIGRLRPLIGDGIVALELPEWKRSRKVLQPVFQRARVQAFAPLFAGATERMLDRWAQAPATPFSLRDEMMRLTLSVVGRALFDADLTGKLDDVGHAFTDALDHVMARIQAPVLVPLWLPTPGNRRFGRARSLVDKTVYGIIADRRGRLDTGPNDLLGMMLELREDGNPLSDEQLRDEIATLLLAGHDTTAYALTWTLYLLARNPETHRRATDEIHAVLGDELPTAEDVDNLPFLGQVVHESLRLYPPSWGLARVPVRDDEVGGHSIPAGAMVLMSPYVLHRHPDYWDDPDAFRPERFADDAVNSRAYLPFGVGPRTCLGQHFATLELRLVLATILRRAQVELIDHEPVPARAGITLQPGRPMMARLRLRD
ncbi:MAG: cytochrome P450 [Nannocystales bacterium]